MSEPEKPQKRPKDEQPERPTAVVVPLRRPFPPDKQPDRLSAGDALRLIRLLAVDSGNIVLLPHTRNRQAQRQITRTQIERCVRNGVISEGPFLNAKGNWQMNLSRFTAGEQVTCVVVIDWPKLILVVTTF